MSSKWLDLIKKEGWEVKGDEILAFGQKFPINHPVAVHLKLYRTETNPERKYFHMKAAHDYLWPDSVWHPWTERRFREHCSGWSYMCWAGGASTAKSYDAAKIALLFWFAYPAKRGVIVASTTLQSVQARVWGYLTQLINEMSVRIPFSYLGGNSPKILVESKSGEIRDTISGIFAVAAGQGTDEASIKNWIGRHPDDALMLVLDECTDLNPAIAKSFPNLDSSEKPFQCIGIGNSNSKFDLHGILATPRNGWSSVDPLKHNKWETTQKNGVCLFFSCYESPAIFEADLARKKKLSKFLITEEQIKEKEDLLGKDSDSFWRFVLGFWRSASTDNIIVSLEHLKQFKVYEGVEWYGMHPLMRPWGLDPAFSTGGDGCLLRMGILGQAADGKIVLDLGKIIKIEIEARSDKSSEIQIAEKVVKLLGDNGYRLEDGCIDANGQGRALGEVLRLYAAASRPPTKIFAAWMGDKKHKSFDVVVKTPYDLWFSFRDFIQNGQIKGMDVITAQQLTSRLIVQHKVTFRPSLEPKPDYRKRMAAVNPRYGHSPDEADVSALVLQSAILNFGFYPAQKKEIAISQGAWTDKLLAWKEETKMREQAHQREIPSASFSCDMFNVPKNRGF